MNRKKKILFGGTVLFFVAVSIALAYWLLLYPNVSPINEKTVLLIPTGSSYSQALDTIYSSLNVQNKMVFEWLAKMKKYPVLVKPGRYTITRRSGYLELINNLRSGNQTPVRVTFNNVRFINDLAGKVGKVIEADSSQIAAFLNDPENYRADGFTKEDVISVFIPDTYSFYWNTSAAGFYKRMLREYNKFWNEERLEKAKEKNLTPKEVSILASIVDDEVSKAEEKPIIAGVYLNRLRKGMPLQACPTIKFALNDFTITRVLTKHLSVNSPYNTYKFKGFPPGPIGCPTREGLEAVLNATKHDYFFFAAKADFSGYHNFSRTLAEHNRYAAEYQKELDRRRIFK